MKNTAYLSLGSNVCDREANLRQAIRNLANVGDVVAVSAFYEKDAVTSVVRFCFAKKDATLDTALERLSDAVHRRQKVAR